MMRNSASGPGRERRVIRGTLFRILAITVQVAATLIVVPVLVGTLGDELFGLWTLISAIAAYFVLFDLGTAHAVQRFSALAVGAQDEERANAVVSNGMVLCTIFSGISLVFTFGGVGLVRHLLEPRLASLGSSILLVLGVEFALTLPLRSLQGVLSANLAQDRIAVYQMLRTIFRTLGIWLVLRDGQGVLAVALVHSASNLLVFGLSSLDAIRNYRWARPSRSKLSRAEMRRLFGFGWFVLLSQFGDLARLRIDSIVIGSTLGLPSVTFYSIAARITEQWSQVVGAFTNTVKTVFAQDHGADRLLSLKTSYFSALRITTLVSLFVGANLLVFGRPFLVHWMGEEYAASYPVLVILCFGFAAALSQSVGVGLLQSLGRPRQYAYLNLLEAIANLGLSLWWVRTYGILGVALGTALPMLVSKLIVQPILVARLLESSFAEMVRHLKVPVAGTVIYYALVYLAQVVMGQPEGLWTLLLTIAFVALVFLGFSIRSLLNERERALLRRFVLERPSS